MNKLFKIQGIILSCVITLLLSHNLLALDQNQLPQLSLNPFTIENANSTDDFISVKLSSQIFSKVSEKIKGLTIDIPLTEGLSITAELEPFNAVSSDAQFYFGTNPTSRPTIKLFRGHITDEPNSLVFLAITNKNKVNGMITTGNGDRYIISEGSKSQTRDIMTIHKESENATLPDFPTFCGVADNATYINSMKTKLSQSVAILNSTTRLATIALDGDLKYVELFDNPTDAQNYAVQLIGAISSIYIRDFDVKLEIDFLRLWTTGGEPYNAGNLGSFASYWDSNENPYDYNIVHLLSGRRDLSFGGIAYLSGTCLSDYTFSISGYLNGSFPSPLDAPNVGNWDVIVGAHEMGHNFGTGHTHDDVAYTPFIDSCAQGFPTQGTIMSYCHIHPGYTTNTELRFHGRVIENIKNVMATSNCWVRDCNDNGIDDAIDISSAFSTDSDANGVPDECEDCNGNGILDVLDILAGATDIDHNNIPDECEPDCNANNFPDQFDIFIGVSRDENYNNLPDECEADCDNNGIIDYLDIKDGTYTDFDRNLVPDTCQDCNSNGIVDWDDTEKQLNLFVGDNIADYVREYHEHSGAPIENHADGDLASCYDILFDDNGNMYTADFTNVSILKTDVLTRTTSTFISSDGHLVSPSALVIAPNGNLLIANSTTSSVVEYDVSSGAYIGDFIPTGVITTSPMAMTFGWDGNLYISSTNDNTVKRYNGSTGLYMSDLVTSASGGLDSPRGLVFDGDGNLLVCSYNTNQILRYNGTTGAFIDVFSDEVEMENPWDIAVGPNGNIFVSRSGGVPRIIEYDPVGRYTRSFVRGDGGMYQPTGIAFKPASDNDCNGNMLPDDCDISSGFSLDANSNLVPDECETIVDADNDGVNSDLDCDDNNPDVQFVETYYFDNDNDTFGDENTSITVCTPPPGYTLVGGDCDDSDPDKNPLAIEICDGKDNDCNGIIDDGLAGIDSDSDGFPDDCDACPNDPDNDIDEDSICGDIDNCPIISNPLQEDANSNNIGDACCCIGTTGNVDDDPNDIVDISDLVVLVDAMFVVGTGVLPCPNEANVDADSEGLIDISDLVLLVDFMFSGPVSLPSCP